MGSAPPARGAGPAPSLPAGSHRQPHRAAFTPLPAPTARSPVPTLTPGARPSSCAGPLRSPAAAPYAPEGHPAASPGPAGPPPRGGLPTLAPTAGRRRSAPLRSRPARPLARSPPRRGAGRHLLSIAGGGGGRREPAGGAGSAVSAPSRTGRGRRRCRLRCAPRAQRPGLPAGRRPAAASPWLPDTRRGGAGASGAGEARAQAPSGRQWEPTAPCRLPALGARLAGPGGAEAAWVGRPAACGVASAGRRLGGWGREVAALISAGRFARPRFFSVQPRGP